MEACPGLEEPMNFTKVGRAFFFFAGGVPAVNAGVCSTSIIAGLCESDSSEL